MIEFPHYRRFGAVEPDLFPEVLLISDEEREEKEGLVIRSFTLPQVRPIRLFAVECAYSMTVLSMRVGHRIVVDDHLENRPNLFLEALNRMLRFSPVAIAPGEPLSMKLACFTGEPMNVKNSPLRLLFFAAK